MFPPLLRQFLLSVIAYEVVVVGGIAAFLAASLLVGYLPYSDRPGPGWRGPSQTIHELRMVWDWISFYPQAQPVYAVAVFAVVRALAAWRAVPGWLIRTVAGLLSSVGAVYWVVAAGWYFSMGLVVQWVALALALFYGVRVLPFFIGVDQRSQLPRQAAP